LCSIPDLPKALREVKRVLKPGGRFIFIEHGQSPKKLNFTVQKIATPITRLYAGNCHLDRKIDDFVMEAGLVIKKLEMSPEGGRPLMHSCEGVAVKE
jgi:ubiquinone/menaquinone biosynthesis C-methylase UbiE